MLTQQCNKACEYCFVRHVLSDKRISFEDFRLYLDYLLENRIKKISLVGGEPTIHPEINRFILYARKIEPELFINIISNGLFDERVFEGVDISHNFTITLNLAHDEREREIIRKNAVFLKEYKADFAFGVLIDREDFDEKDILDQIEMIDPDKIVFRIALPNLPRNNKDRKSVV